MNSYILDETELENRGNIGKDLTLDFLANNGFIETDVAEELQKTLFVVCKKNSWFSRIFKKEKDEARFWRLAKLVEIPQKETLKDGEEEPPK